MLGVTSETSWGMTDSAWISEELDETIIISTCDQGLNVIKVDSIDVGSICTLWEDTINEPSELGMTS